MLYMVIERFRDVDAISERYLSKGRMMPDGVSYFSSWIDPTGSKCYQIMNAESRDLLDLWMSRWSDVMDFEVIPVLTSADFWAGRRSK